MWRVSRKNLKTLGSAMAVQLGWSARYAGIFIFAVTILFGCAHYPLPGTEGQAKDELAYLVGRPSTWEDYELVLRKIDAVPGPTHGFFSRGDDSKWFGSSWDGSYRIDLLPGAHTLTIKCTSREGAHIEYETEFTARAGHIYEPRAVVENERWRVWIEDITGRSD